MGVAATPVESASAPFVTPGRLKGMSTSTQLPGAAALTLAAILRT
jgi:hypothetical protein